MDVNSARTTITRFPPPPSTLFEERNVGGIVQTRVHVHTLSAIDSCTAKTPGFVLRLMRLFPLQPPSTSNLST